MSLEPVISYFDTTIGCVAFNITPAAKQEVIDAVVEANELRKSKQGDADERRMNYATSVAAVVENLHYPLLVHEWAHVLQTIAYPALYVRCLRELVADDWRPLVAAMVEPLDAIAAEQLTDAVEAIVIAAAV